jgi:dihydrofolate reductase
MTLSIIAAINSQGLMGIDNELPWNLPEDLAWFKKLTTGNTIIMGRNTWESLPFKPLPLRLNIVVSSSLVINDRSAPGVDNYYVEPYIVTDIKSAVLLSKKLSPDNDIFLIGGSGIYGEGLLYVDTLYLTHVKNGPHDVTHDMKKMWKHKLTWFPKIDLHNDWEAIASDAYETHTSVTYIKKST